MGICRWFGDYFRMLRKRVGSIQDNFIGRMVVVVRCNPFGFFLIFVMMAAFLHTFRIETQDIAMMMMRKHHTADQQQESHRNKQTGNLLFQHFSILKTDGKSTTFFALVLANARIL